MALRVVQFACTAHRWTARRITQVANGSIPHRSFSNLCAPVCRFGTRNAFEARGGLSGHSHCAAIAVRIIPTIQHRKMATAPSHTGVEAVRFTYSEDEAKSLFREWCRLNTPFTTPPQIKDIRAFFVPFWCFTTDITVRSAKNNTVLLRRFGQRGPALMVYAGAMLPRVMAEVLKADTDAARSFSFDMLENRTVDIEPFATYETTAWQVAKDKQIAHAQELHPDLTANDSFSFDDVESRRILMPAYVVEYTYMFETFRVIISGSTGYAFGIQQQKIFGNLSKFTDKRIGEFLRNFLRSTDAQTLNGVVKLLSQLTVFFLRPLSKLIFWPPFFIGTMFAVGGFVLTRGTRAIRKQRKTFIEWEETRKAEMKAQAAMTDDWTFRPSGKSRADRAKEAAQESRTSRQAYYERTTAFADSHSDSTATSKKRVYKRIPPVHPDDYYSVLGLQDLGPRATKTDVQAAFRRELMKYHPDHQNDESPYDPQDCGERTRLIIKAYGELRDPNKKAVYDRTWRPK